MKMALVLCATIILCLLPLSASQDPTVTATTSDMTAIPGQTTTFKCIFTGVAIPYWVVNGVGDSPVTITQGSTVMSFTMPAISETDLEVQLDVSVDLSLNSTTYVCQSDFVGGRATSVPAALTVYGPPLAPNVLSHGARYKSVRLGWERPWSSDLAPVRSYVVQLLQSDGTVLEEDTVDAGSTVDRENTFDNLIHDTEYKARVAAVNSVGQGPWSDEETIKTPFPEPPPPPVDIKLTVAIAGGAATVTASWAAPTIDLESQTEVTEYTIFYGTGDFTSVTRPASVTSYEIPSPVLFSTYQLKMTATNIGGTSVESGTVSKAVEYLQDVSGVGGCKHLNVTCTFASSIDITLQCSVDLAGPTAKSVMVIKETTSTTAVVMVSDLEAGKYNITAKALTADGSEASPYTRKQYLIAVTTEPTDPPPPPDDMSSETPPKPPETSPPEPSAIPTPPVAPTGTTFTTEQTGIIAVPTGAILSTTASSALPARPTASSETVSSRQTTVTVTVLSVLLSLVLTLLLFTCAVSAVGHAVMYKRLQRGRAEPRGGGLEESVKAGPEGEGPPTREEEDGGEKIKANPAYQSIEMGYMSQEDKYIDVPS